MKIGFVTTMAAQPWGGSEPIWVEIAGKAIEEGHEVIASIFDWGIMPTQIIQLENKGAKVLKRGRISYSNLKGKVKGKLRERIFGLKELRSILNYNPDFLVINQGSFVDMEIKIYQEFLLSLDIPYINIVHVNTEDETFPFERIERIRRVYQKSKKVFFVSNRIREVAARQIQFGFENSGLIRNPVNMKDKSLIFFPKSERIEFAVVGRLFAKVKGQDRLLQVLSDSFWLEKNWHLNLYGKGKDENLLRALVSFFNLKDRVTFHGHVQDIRQDIWVKNHILLMPSLYEGLPVSLIEAMLCGRPAVVSNVGGNAEMIDDDINGFVAESSSPQSFEKALKRMWNRKNELEKIGIEAREKAINIYGGDIIDEEFGKLLKVISYKNPTKYT